MVSSDTIEALRKALAPLLTVPEYMATMRRCQAAAYGDFKKYPGLAIKHGRSTRVVRDVMLDIMASLPAWVPENERPRKRQDSGVAVGAESRAQAAE